MTNIIKNLYRVNSVYFFVVAEATEVLIVRDCRQPANPHPLAASGVERFSCAAVDVVFMVVRAARPI